MREIDKLLNEIPLDELTGGGAFDMNEQRTDRIISKTENTKPARLKGRIPPAAAASVAVAAAAVMSVALGSGIDTDNSNINAGTADVTSAGSEADLSGWDSPADHYHVTGKGVGMSLPQYVNLILKYTPDEIEQLPRETIDKYKDDPTLNDPDYTEGDVFYVSDNGAEMTRRQYVNLLHGFNPDEIQSLPYDIIEMYKDDEKLMVYPQYEDIDRIPPMDICAENLLYSEAENYPDTYVPYSYRITFVLKNGNVYRGSYSMNNDGTENADDNHFFEKLYSCDDRFWYFLKDVQLINTIPEQDIAKLEASISKIDLENAEVFDRDKDGPSVWNMPANVTVLDTSYTTVYCYADGENGKEAIRLKTYGSNTGTSYELIDSSARETIDLISWYSFVSEHLENGVSKESIRSLSAYDLVDLTRDQIINRLFDGECDTWTVSTENGELFCIGDKEKGNPDRFPISFAFYEDGLTESQLGSRKPDIIYVYPGGNVGNSVQVGMTYNQIAEECNMLGITAWQPDLGYTAEAIIGNQIWSFTFDLSEEEKAIVAERFGNGKTETEVDISDLDPTSTMAIYEGGTITRDMIPDNDLLYGE